MKEQRYDKNGNRSDRQGKNLSERERRENEASQAGGRQSGRDDDDVSPSVGQPDDEQQAGQRDREDIEQGYTRKRGGNVDQDDEQEDEDSRG